MQTKSIGEVKLDECTNCKGTWFDHDELRQVKDLAAPDASWLDFEIWKHPEQLRTTPSGLTCPACGTGLKTITYGATDVAINYCEQCRGTWLERGELRKIIEQLNREINSKTFLQYVQEAVKEGAELIIGSESFASEWKDFKKVLYLLRLRLFVQTGLSTQGLPFGM